MTDRLRALDGVRGVAALVVLLHHATLLSPLRAGIFAPGATPGEPGSALWWVSSTPLVLAVVGGEAVFVFFVLSGFVLTLPALESRFDWFAYFPRRVVRLLLPVTASVVLATVLLLVPRDPSTASSWWVADSFALETTWQSPLAALELLYGDTSINNPLWSLRYELLFSLLLPIYVLVALALRRWWVLGIVGTLVLLAASWVVPNPVWRHLPMFLLGAFLAVGLPHLRALASRPPTPWRHALWALGLVVALLAIAARWLAWPVTSGTPFVTSVPGVVSLAGATMLIVIAIAWHPLARLLESAPFRWLGRVSFSLYLVHVPIILACAALAPGARWWVPAVIGVVVSLVAAELFARGAELPLHRASRAAGRAARRVLDRRSTDAAARE